MITLIVPELLQGKELRATPRAQHDTVQHPRQHLCGTALPLARKSQSVVSTTARAQRLRATRPPSNYHRRDLPKVTIFRCVCVRAAYPCFWKKRFRKSSQDVCYLITRVMGYFLASPCTRTRCFMLIRPHHCSLFRSL